MGRINQTFGTPLNRASVCMCATTITGAGSRNPLGNSRGISRPPCKQESFAGGKEGGGEGRSRPGAEPRIRERTGPVIVVWFAHSIEIQENIGE